MAASPQLPALDTSARAKEAAADAMAVAVEAVTGEAVDSNQSPSPTSTMAPDLNESGAKGLVSKLLDTATRPDAVYSCLSYLGAERILEPEHLEKVAQLSTVAGLRDTTSELTTLAKPYVEKAKHKEGRQQLVVDAKELMGEAKGLAREKLVKPTTGLVGDTVNAGLGVIGDKVNAGLDLLETRVVQPTKHVAVPYLTTLETQVVQPTKKVAAPYLAKLEESREKIVSSEQYGKMTDAIKHVRETPACDLLSEITTKLRDFLKSEEFKEYREYVLSPQFRADVRQSVYSLFHQLNKQRAALLSLGLPPHYLVLRPDDAELVTQKLSTGQELLHEVLAELHARPSNIKFDFLSKRLEPLQAKLDSIEKFFPAQSGSDDEEQPQQPPPREEPLEPQEEPPPEPPPAQKPPARKHYGKSKKSHKAAAAKETEAAASKSEGGRDMYTALEEVASDVLRSAREAEIFE